MYTIKFSTFLFCYFVVINKTQSLNREPSCFESNGSSVLVEFEDESPVYWECWNGIKSLKTCPDGLWFDDTQQKCVHPDRYKNLGQIILDSRCENISDTIEFLPDPVDCSRYIQCYHGNAYLMPCLPGTWFNSLEKICVEPELSGCVVTLTTIAVTPIPSVCEDVPDGQIVLKKCSCGCKFYWVCHGKSQTLKACPYEAIHYVYFAEERQFCSILANEHCSDETNTPAAWTPTYPIMTNEPSYDDPRCKGIEGIYLSHPTTCTKFIECLPGWNYEFDCPDGLHFNADLQKCVMPADSRCDPRCTAGAFDFFPDPLNCSQYYQCYDGSTYLMVCPEDLWFSPSEKQCVAPEISDCSVTTPTTTTTTVTTTTTISTTRLSTPAPEYVCGDVPEGKKVLKPSSLRCSIYWECDGPKQTMKHCRNDDQSEGYMWPLSFDKDRWLCGATVFCNQNTRTPFPYTTGGPTLAPTLPDFNDPRCESYNVFGDWTFLSHPGDCSKFIECQIGPHGSNGYERDCPEGFYFSTAKKACVVPEESDCYKSLQIIEI